MKKISFFLALILSLNTGIVLRKEEEDQNIQLEKHYRAKSNKGTMLWLQNLVKHLKIGFYLVNKNGDFKYLAINKTQQKHFYHRYRILSKNCIRFDYYEIF